MGVELLGYMAPLCLTFKNLPDSLLTFFTKAYGALFLFTITKLVYLEVPPP